VKFVVRKSKNGQFWWQIVAGNGEVMAASEQMVNKQSCLSAIESVMEKAGDAEVVDKTDED
jgi:uncharacterized protein YegP (UPF0339 family)